MNYQKKQLTVVEASKICGVTRATVWRWIKTGQLDAAKTAGGHYRIYDTVLQTFMDQKKMHSRCRGNQTKKILIVDDDLLVQKFLDRLLSQEKFQLFYASNGFEAGMKINKLKPDLLILDLYMPQVNGFEVCEQIKKDPETSKIKIIAISGFDTKENKEKILEYGADIFYPKPIDSKQLIKGIKHLIK